MPTVIKMQNNSSGQVSNISIVNFSMGNNFGAVIAALCLENEVKKAVSKETVTETVNYDRSVVSLSFTEKLHLRLSALSETIRTILTRFHLLTPPKNPVNQTFQNNTINFNNEIKKQRYDNFRKIFLNITKKQNDIDLKNSTKPYAALICGSDVIWHPNILASGTSKAFYLNFGDKNTRRIAYAPSIDFKDGKELRKYRRLYKKELKKFDFVSVREKDSVDFIQSVTKKKVQQCCDPVFLYRPEDFDEMISVSEETVPDEEYIYAYILRKNDYAVEYIKNLAREKGLKIYFYAEEYKDLGVNSVNCFSDGPAEFLQRVKSAKYIVTTSFHCVAFSLIFKKQFLSFTRSETGNKIPDVLETFGVTDRQVDDGVIKNIDDPIDFDSVENRINALRQQSLDYLRSALKDI